MRPIINSPRILRTGQPLTLAALQQVCPSVLATEPHSSRGPKYRYVPTIEPVKMLMDNGWGIYEASQQRSRVPGKNGYTKHMLRMRKLDDFTERMQLGNTGDGVAEVILINAHDGTGAYQLKAGYFRFVCSNGLIAGTTLAGFKVVHSMGRQTSEEVLTAGERMVTEQFPIMLSHIDQFRIIKLNTDYQYRLAERALALRWPNTLAPITREQLLVPQRSEDEEPSLWNVLNRVQEQVVYGGAPVVSAGYGRRGLVRPVERVSAVTAINTGLWDETLAIAKELA